MPIRHRALGHYTHEGQGNVLVLAPPLVIAEAELDQGLDIVEQSLRA